LTDEELQTGNSCRVYTLSKNLFLFGAYFQKMRFYVNAKSPYKIKLLKLEKRGRQGDNILHLKKIDQNFKKWIF